MTLEFAKKAQAMCQIPLHHVLEVLPAPQAANENHHQGPKMTLQVMAALTLN